MMATSHDAYVLSLVDKLGSLVVNFTGILGITSLQQRLWRIESYRH
jgi:hypothetical protein